MIIETTNFYRKPISRESLIIVFRRGNIPFGQTSAVAFRHLEKWREGRKRSGLRERGEKVVGQSMKNTYMQQPPTELGRDRLAQTHPDLYIDFLRYPKEIATDINRICILFVPFKIRYMTRERNALFVIRYNLTIYSFICPLDYINVKR